MEDAIEHITIKIETGNSAFDGSQVSEIARILRKLADDFERHGAPSHYIRDLNGNLCGSIQILRKND